MSYETLGLDNLLQKKQDQITSLNVNGLAGSLGFGDTQVESLRDGEISGNLEINDGYIQSKGFTSGSAGWKINANGNAEFNNITLFGGTIKYQKTSFTDSTNAGYYIGSEGLYFGTASDTKYFKYTISSGALEIYGGTITSGLIRTAASGTRIELNGSDNRLNVYSGSSAVGFIGKSDSNGTFIALNQPDTSVDNPPLYIISDQSSNVMYINNTNADVNNVTGSAALAISTNNGHIYSPGLSVYNSASGGYAIDTYSNGGRAVIAYDGGSSGYGIWAYGDYHGFFGGGTTRVYLQYSNCYFYVDNTGALHWVKGATDLTIG